MDMTDKTIAFGSVDATGNLVTASSSFHVAKTGRTSKGRYWIEFLAGTFQENPVVVATVAAPENKGNQDGTNRTISVTFVSTIRIELGIRIASQSDTNDDRPFSFIAIGVPG